MKFRVETLDTSNPDAGWVREGPAKWTSKTLAQMFFECHLYSCYTHERVRLVTWGPWPLGDKTLAEAMGTKKGTVVDYTWCAACEGKLYQCPSHRPKEPTNPAPDTSHKQQCRCSCCYYKITQGWKEKPMSTKQRGDVERFPAPNPPALFRVWLDDRHDNALDFNRDEFRRIWEAGNKEFGGNSTVYINASVQELAEKDAEIARLKAAIHYPTFDTNLLREIERMRAWFGKIQEWTSPDSPAEMAKKALRGEKAP